MNRKTKRYLLIAYVWTWLGWILSYLISHLQGSVLSTNSTVFSLWTDSWGSNRFLPQVLFAVAVYGPFVGFLVSGGLRMLPRKADMTMHLWQYVILIPFLSVLPATLLSIAFSSCNPQGLALTAIISSVLLYFVSNLITSGTEEFGWRGILYPDMKARGMSFWDIAWKGGIIWAVWHFPLMFILYLPMGPAVLIPSLIGFTASIVAMNYITNFLYEKTNNIWLAILLHALNNTMNFVVMLLFPATPFSILTNVMPWLIVWWLDKRKEKNNI